MKDMNLKTFISTIIMIAILASCSYSKDNTVETLKKLEIDTQEAAIEIKTNAFSGLNVNKFEDDLENENLDVIIENISKINRYFMAHNGALKLINDPKEELISMLEIYNSSVLFVYNKEGNSARVNQILEDYEASIYNGCDETLSNCKNHSFYKLDSNTISILKIFAKNDVESILDYYTHLKLADNIFSDDEELKKLIIAKSLNLFSFYLKKSKSDEKINDRDISTIEWLITHIKLGIDKNLVNAEIIQVLFDWMVNNKLDTFLGSKRAKIFKEIIVNRIKTEAVWPKFNEFVQNKENQSRSDNSQDLLYPTTFSQLYNKSVKLNSNIFKVMNVQDQRIAEVTSKDEVIYAHILGNLLRGENLNLNKRLWEKTEMNETVFLSMLHNHLKALFLYNFTITGQKLSDYFQEFLKDEGRRDMFMSETLRFSKENLSSVWTQFFKVINRFEVFYYDLYKQNLYSDSFQNNTNQREEIRTFFSELEKNIQLFVTYPNMLMFAYYADKIGFSKWIDSFFIQGGFTIDDKEILRAFFKGRIPPLYDFYRSTTRHSDVALDQVEIMYATYYTIYSGLLKTYKVNSKDWFARISRTYLSDQVDPLKMWIRAFKGLHSTGSGKKTHNICQNIKNNTSFKNRLELGDITSRTFLGNFGRRQKLEFSGIISYLHPFDSKLEYTVVEALEVIRTDLNPKLRQLEIIIDTYKNSVIARDGHLSRNESQIVKGMQAELATIKKLRKQIFDLSKKTTNLVNDCFSKARDIELKRRKEIFKMELEYLRHTWIAITALNHMNADSNKTVSELKEQYSDHHIWNDSFFNKLNANQTLLIAIKELLHKELNLKEIFNEVRGYEEDYLNKAGIQQEPNGEYIYVQRSLDLNVRLSHYLKYGYNEEQVSYQNDIVELALPETLKELQEQVMGASWRRQRYDTKAHILAVDSDNNENDIMSYYKNSLKRYELKFKWFIDTHSAANVIRSILKTNVSLYKVKYTMVDQNTDHSEEMLQDAIKMNKLNYQYVKSFMIDDFDRTTLKVFGVSSHFGMVGGPNFLYSVSTFDRDYYIGMADDLFTFVTSYHLGKNPEFRGYRQYAEEATSFMPQDDRFNDRLTERDIKSARTTMFTDAYDKKYVRDGLGFYLTLKNKQHFIVPVTKEALKQIHTSYKFPIRQEQKVINAFVEATKKFSLGTNVEPFQFNIEIPANQNAEFLTPFLVGNYYADMEDYHEKTSGVFRLAE